MVRQYRGAGGGYRSGQSDECIFTLDSLLDRNIVLVEYDVYFFTARVKTR